MGRASHCAHHILMEAWGEEREPVEKISSMVPFGETFAFLLRSIEGHGMPGKPMRGLPAAY